jgi:hypothetical protein
MPWDQSAGPPSKAGDMFKRSVNYHEISSNRVGWLMGGQGSGGHNSKGKLRDVQCARLDVHELAREGKLKLGTRGRLYGAIGFEVEGGPDALRLVLEFPCRPTGESLDAIRQVICCYWRKAYYGGRYLMFLCSECHRSARVLYARVTSHHIWFFSCRNCAGIAYQSAMGHRWDRSARRVEKLRARLEWRTGGTVPIRPRAMHERTYQRILRMLSDHEAVRNQGASYARKSRPEQHYAHLWRQCRNRFAGLGGWPSPKRTSERPL